MRLHSHQRPDLRANMSHLWVGLGDVVTNDLTLLLQEPPSRELKPESTVCSYSLWLHSFKYIAPFSAMADGTAASPEVFVVTIISRLLTDLVARNDQVQPTVHACEQFQKPGNS